MTHRVYVSADLEGVAGVSHLRQTMRGTDDYPDARALMAAEVNAAVEGALDGGAQSVLVNDAHGDMTNLRAADLHPAAVLLSGWPKVPWAMMQGIEPADLVVCFIGYHSPAGTGGSVLEHTFSSRLFMDLRVNGDVWGEAEFNAALAAELGVPVGLATGDGVFCAAVAERIPGIETVAVKQGFGYNVSSSMHPSLVRERIRVAARRAVERAIAGDLPLLALPERYVVEATLPNGGAADLCTLLPDTERLGGRLVRRVTETADGALRTVLGWLHLAGAQAPGHPTIPGGRA
ncbi:M55 family metallopeptidase [Jiangella anatolica]|uniref:M55 family metallopeptidase n=1 Tax=Jiangella anatolica TaxID=2670374 RepID=UPI001314C783|nr:M55 family metallopeptidase [Jiangella anatolica]